ncbi:MAG: hypothetical protein AYP45_13025 [Candidatus Brocadia carolinensis]|uniref:Uncharacterized protein n=1 Tax=Candidatus Brocadia carolinensis TaxID=1004156 RepID=A0A1V4ARL6_9BACT|nr:MAG: hypothetical protein AYP45_13025 [Candidatus Brocadia caroliniensis]
MRRTAIRAAADGGRYAMERGYTFSISDILSYYVVKTSFFISFFYVICEICGFCCRPAVIFVSVAA